MSTPTATAVTTLLAAIPDPETGRPLTEMGQIVSVDITTDAIRTTVGLATHSAILWKTTRARIEESLRTAFPQVARVDRRSVAQPLRRPAGWG